MGAFNGTYERMIIRFNAGTVQGLWTRIGIGGWGAWSSGGPYQSVMLGILTGSHGGHFELNAGGARMVNQRAYAHAQDMNNYLAVPLPLKSSYINIHLAGAMGYRYQKPGGHFLFRCGVG